jgi:predicted ATP-grasp superfamily ATP-dependent carboligase
MAKNRPVLIVPGENVSALGFTRSLGEHGVPVIPLTFQGAPADIGLFSKYCRGRVGHLGRDARTFVHGITALVKQLGQRPVLLAASDDAALLLAATKPELEPWADIPAPDHSLVHRLVHKSALYAIAEAQGIACPESHVPASDADLRRIARNMRYPCLLKADYSPGFRAQFRAKGFLVASPAELERRFAQVQAAGGEALVQEFIPGDVTRNCGVAAYFDRASRPHGMLMYQWLAEWPPPMPDPAITRSVSVPELAAPTAHFFTALGYHGIVQVQFKRDPRDERFKLIDVNPRAYTSNRLAPACGCNLAYLAYCDMTGARAESSPPRLGLTWVHEDHVASLVLRSLVRGGPGHRAWRVPLGSERIYAIYDRTDPRPFGAWLGRDAAGHLLRALS